MCMRMQQRMSALLDDGFICKETEGQARLADETRSCRPATAVTPGNIQRVDDIIRGDRRVKTD